MAENLEQAVETAEPEKDVDPLAPQEGGKDAPSKKPVKDQKKDPQGNTSDGSGSNDGSSEALSNLFNDDETVSDGPEPLTSATLHARFVISPDIPLTELNTPTSLAFHVEDLREANRSLFALVCSTDLSVNIGIMLKLRSSSAPGVLPMIDFGPVYWSPAGEKCMIVIYEKPLGGRFIDSFGSNTVHFNEYEIGPRFVELIIPVIQKFSTLGEAHHGIRLDNLYYMDKDCTILVVGDCVTSPPGYNQPKIYESLERAMTMPSGRGAGTNLDDIYALGICVVFLLLHKNPVRKLSDEDVIIGRCDEGTYKFLCSKERIPLPLIEAVRGILADDPEERWTLDAIHRWMEGQKAHVTQRKALLSSKSPYKFNDKSYHSPRSIAYAFANNIQDAVKAVKGGKLDSWLRKALNRPDIADDIGGLMALMKVHDSKPDGSGDVLISKVCIRMDPAGPIRFKNFSFMLDGFKDAFSMEYLRSGNFKIQGQILARNLITYWAASQITQDSEINRQVKSFNALRNFAKTPVMGYGMERCLYELNRSLPCQGEYLKHESVHNIDRLLPALNEISKHNDNQVPPIDKHIAAFIATHFNQDVHTQLKTLDSEQEDVSTLGLLSMYALIQWKQDHKNLFELTSWFGNLLQPVIQTYHSHTTQRTIEQEIPAIIRQGNLPNLFDLIDNPERRNLDSLTFRQAQYQFSQAEEEIQGMVGEDINQEQIALESGETATAMFAVIASMLASSVIIFFMLM